MQLDESSGIKLFAYCQIPDPEAWRGSALAKLRNRFQDLGLIPRGAIQPDNPVLNPRWGQPRPWLPFAPDDLSMVEGGGLVSPCRSRVMVDDKRDKGSAPFNCQRQKRVQHVVLQNGPSHFPSTYEDASSPAGIFLTTFVASRVSSTMLIQLHFCVDFFQVPSANASFPSSPDGYFYRLGGQPGLFPPPLTQRTLRRRHDHHQASQPRYSPSNSLDKTEQDRTRSR